jgi:hypothetical protein
VLVCAASLKPSLTSRHESGETMAATRTKVDPAALQLMADMAFVDQWADATKATPRDSITISYAGLPAGTAPDNGILNYPDHVQPIWNRNCIGCHTAANKLDLTSTISGTGRMTSYQELLLGDPLIVNGQPVTRLRDGELEVVRGPALVETMVNGADGMTRSSRLGEILYGETLKASDEARTAFPTPPNNHAALLTAAERRVVTEWMDLGGQYFNNVMASNSPAKRATALSRASFDSTVHPVLKAQCAACHQPAGSSGAASTGGSFAKSRFVLTGSPMGDYNVTLSMISDTCTLNSNALIVRPSTTPHPSGALQAGSAGYTAIANWITSGCAPR